MTNDYCTIYVIKNSINNKVYIGQTWKLLRIRFAAHINTNRCIKLNNAILKYGSENFSIEELCRCYSQEDANEKEIFYIKEYNSVENGYNCKFGGNFGGNCSEETKEKISKANKGRASPKKGIPSGKKGIPIPKTIGERNSQAKLNWKKVKEIREKYLNKNITKTSTYKLGKEYGVSSNTIRNIVLNLSWREENLNIQEQPIVIKKEIKTLYKRPGKKHSEETKMKMSLSRKGKPRKKGYKVSKQAVENHGKKFNWNIISNIRDDYFYKNLTKKEMCIKFNTSKRYLNKILSNKIWKDDNYIVLENGKQN